MQSSTNDSFYLLMFRLKSAPSNRGFFFPLLYQTAVNKSEGFNIDRLNESESTNKALSRDPIWRHKRNNNQMTVSVINNGLNNRKL